MKRSTSVTVAAALLLAGGLFIVFIATVAVLGGLFVHTAPTPTPPRGQEPFGPPLLALGSEGLLALWAIVTAVGIFRLRNWARISILVLSSFLAVSMVFGLVAGIWGFSLLMEAQGRDIPKGTNTFLAVMVIAVTGVPLGCAIWWIILFLRKNIRAQFQAAALEGAPVSVARAVVVSPTLAATASAVPAPSAAEMPKLLKIPTSIYVIAIYLLATSAVGLLGLPFTAALATPNILLGIAVTGWKAWASLAAMMALQLALGITLLRTRCRAIDGTIAYTVFVLLNSLLFSLFLFFPAGDTFIAAALGNVRLPPNFPPELIRHFMQVILIFSMIFSVLITVVALYFLFTRRRAYLSVCALRAKSL